MIAGPEYVTNKKVFHVVVLHVDVVCFRPKSMGSDEFCRDCVRCGRTLVNAGEHVWRWTGFNMGLDLIWSCSTHTLRVKRNHHTEHEVMLSMQSRRHIICR